LLLFEPLVDAELVANVVSLDDQKFLVEFFAQLALPLKRQVRGTDDENALGEPTELEFADQKTSHHRFAGPRVVSQQKADASELQQVIVDGLKLMREWIDARDRKGEVRVELVGNSKSVRL